MKKIPAEWWFLSAGSAAMSLGLILRFVVNWTGDDGDLPPDFVSDSRWHFSSAAWQKFGVTLAAALSMIHGATQAAPDI